jgi:hypothetical protein
MNNAERQHEYRGYWRLRFDRMTTLCNVCFPHCYSTVDVWTVLKNNRPRLGAALLNEHEFLDFTKETPAEIAVRAKCRSAWRRFDHVGSALSELADEDGPELRCHASTSAEPCTETLCFALHGQPKFWSCYCHLPPAGAASSE